MAINNESYTNFINSTKEGIKNIAPSSLTDIIDKIYNNYIVVEANSGADGLVFSLLEDFNISGRSTLSKHIMEDGEYVTDHMINDPLQITLTGFMAEETFNFQSIITNISNFISKQVGLVGIYAPQLTQGAMQQFQQVANKVNTAKSYADGLISNTRGFFNILDDFIPTDSKQEKMLKKLLEARDKKQVFDKIEFPIGANDFVATSMSVNKKWVIVDFNWKTNVAKTGKTLSNLSVTFEEFTTTTLQTQLKDITAKKSSNIVNQQKDKPKKTNIIEGEKIDDSSIFWKLFQFFKN